MIASYARMYEGQPELAILRGMGYFNRPAEPAALKLVLPEMEERRYRAAMKRLQDARLILPTDPLQPLDCHALVRDHFAAESTREGHTLLYEHYKKQAPYRPDTFEAMTPLFYAVYHGCQSGQYQEALNDVYDKRIQHGDRFFLLRMLGAFASNLSLLANFFATPWTQPTDTLSPGDQIYVIGEVGISLRAAGRLAEALEPMRLAARADVKSEDWKNAAISNSNFGELNLTLGNVETAIATAVQAANFADRCGDKFRIATRANLAEAVLFR